MKRIACDSCGRSGKYKESVKTRSVKGMPPEFLNEVQAYSGEIVEIGLECPHCKTWAHSHFNGPQLDSFREALREATDLLESLRGSLNPRALDKAEADMNGLNKPDK